MNPDTGRVPPRQQTRLERDNLSTVCGHLALVAIDGATDEVAQGLAPGFRLHLDQLDTDRWGYLVLVEAKHAAHVTRPALDVEDGYGAGEFVTLRLQPRCIAHFRLAHGMITEMWVTTDWQVWREWLIRHTMT